jgi:hypothetical protein
MKVSDQKQSQRYVYSSLIFHLGGILHLPGERAGLPRYRLNL